MTLHAERQLAFCETSADNSKEEVASVEMVADLVHPFAVAAFIATIQGVEGDAVLRSQPVSSERQLNE